MLTIILLCILCFQTITCARKPWDLTSPIIVNQNGNDVFFPRYVAEKTNGNSLEESTIIYKEPGDKTTLTYAFCGGASGSNILKGTLIEKGPPAPCPTPRQDFSRIMVVGEDGKTVPCGNKKKNMIDSSYFRYSMQINLYINKLLTPNLYIDEIKDTYKLVLYDYCYDYKNTQSMLYAYHDLDNPSLLTNELLVEEQHYKFDMQKVEGSPMSNNEKETLASYGKQNIYQAFEVAISAFVPYGHWIRSFFQWHNAAPMNKNVIPIWGLFLRNIRSKLSQMKTPLKIYSGVYDLLRINGTVQYLPDSTIPIPSYWWVALYNKDRTQGISLIMHNYSYGFREEKVVPLCGESVCGNVGLQGAVPQGEGYSQAHIYCCPAATIATKFDFHQDDELLKFPDEYSTVLSFDDF